MGDEIPSYVTCPGCGRTISNPMVDSAETGEGTGADYFMCECGERITFWGATAQLREQKKLGTRLRAWFRSFSKGRD